MKKILVVDDNAIDMHDGTKALVCAGVNNEIMSANTGADAIRLLLEHSDIVLVLLDLKMPPPDGLEVLEFIRNNQDTRKRMDESSLSVICTTGAITEKHRELLRAMGVKEVLIKRFFFSDLHPSLLATGRTITIE